MKNATILKEAGYEIGGTGGGCESWCKEINGYSVMIGSDAMADVDDKETLDECGLVWNISAFGCKSDIFEYLQGHSPKCSIQNILKCVDFITSLDFKQAEHLCKNLGDFDEKTDEYAETDFLYARGILHGIDKDVTALHRQELNKTCESLKSLISDWEREKIDVDTMAKTLCTVFHYYLQHKPKKED
jgi:hypothetical protein